MPAALLQPDERGYRAPEQLTIHNARQLRTELLAAIDTDGADQGVTLVMDRVVQLDTAAVQLLLSARLTLAEMGRELTITQPSDAVRRTVAHLGLADALLGARP